MRDKECFYTICNDNVNHKFYIDNEVEYSYAQLQSLVCGTSFYLKNMGVHDKQRVPLILNNSLDFFVCLFALISLGACAALIEPKKKASEISDILEQLECTLLITDKALDLECTGIKQCIYNRNNVPEVETRSLTCNMESEGCIIYTSGSTSKPKGVIRTNRILFEHSVMLQRMYQITENDATLCLVQPQHALGLENSLAAIYSGAALSIQNEFSHNDICDKISSGNFTILVGVPFQYGLINKLNRKITSHKLRYMLSAGAPLNKDINKELYQLFQLPVTQIYGSSELGATAINIDVSVTLNYDTVGKLVPRVCAKILNTQGKKVDEGEIGEIVLCSPFCTTGYITAEQTSSDSDAYVKDGWFYSGDLGYVDLSGYIYITGRKKNIINIAGKKVSPEEVEAFIKSLVGVKDVKVQGENDAAYGETIIADVVLERGHDIDTIVIYEKCKKHLSDYKIPRRINFVQSLEYTNTGKVKR